MTPPKRAASAPSPPSLSFALTRPIAAVLLFSFLCAVTELVHRSIWIDELLEYYTDTQPFAEIVRTQLHHPFSLEPPAFHLIVHAFQCVLGPTLFAQRLPSVLAFMFAQYAIFCLARYLAGGRAALIGAFVPMLIYSRHYAIEGRCYAVLLACGAGAMLFWAAAATAQSSARRIWSLAGLFLSLVLAVTAHYDGPLLLIPVMVGELWRTVSARRLNVPVVGTIGLAACSVLLDLPFAPAALAYKAHYYPEHPTLASIPFCYRWLLGMPGPPAVGNVVVVVCGLALLGYSFWEVRRDHERSSLSFWFAAVAMALLPVFACFFSVYVTHAFEPRYTLPAVAAFALLLSISVRPLLRSRVIFGGVVALAACSAALLARREVRKVTAETAGLQAILRLPASVAPGGVPGGPIYVHDPSAFLFAHFYLPPPVSDRFVLVYSTDLEYRWLGHDASSRFDAAMSQTLGQRSGFHFLTYEQFRRLADPMTVLIVLQNDRDEWLQDQLPVDGFTLQPEGAGLEGVFFRAIRSKNRVLPGS